MIGIIIMTVVALFLSILLVIVDTFANKKNDKCEEYLKLLPGYNCGACGFGSCQGMSEAMCDNAMNYKKCRPLRGEKLEKMEEYLNLSFK